MPSKKVLYNFLYFFLTSLAVTLRVKRCSITLAGVIVDIQMSELGNCFTPNHFPHSVSCLVYSFYIHSFYLIFKSVCDKILRTHWFFKDMFFKGFNFFPHDWNTNHLNECEMVHRLISEAIDNYNGLNTITSDVHMFWSMLLCHQ